VPDLVPIIDQEADSSIFEHAEVDSLTFGGKHTLLTFENTGPGDAIIDSIRGEADIDAEFFVFLNAVQKDATRTSISTPTAQFLYPNKGLKVPPGSTIEVKMEHHFDDDTATARVSLFGHRDG
jgi:hypothetical protein